MKLLENVKLKKGIAAHIPWLSNNTAQGIYPNVYLPAMIYDNLKSSKPRIRNLAILAHEQRHVERQVEVGKFKWDWKYTLCPKFKFNEELIATKAEMGVYKKYGKKYGINKSAKYLSGWLYFWPVSYGEAKKRLEKVWLNA